MLRGTCHCAATAWTMEGDPGPATACNCTLCRRYGALWAYDFEDGRIRVEGPLAAYRRAELTRHHLEILFCARCACVVAWRGLELDEQGRRRMAVNLRLTAPEQVAHLPIDHFEGLVSFDDLPRDGKTVGDYWF